MDKINQLIKGWQKGSIKLSSALNQMGYQKDLLKKYVQSGWLESLGYGAYKLAGDNVEWYGAINALQEQKTSNIHPGGKTALTLKGYAHYLGTTLNLVNLFGNKADRLPKWFMNNPWKTNIKYIQTNLFDYNSLNIFSVFELDNLKLNISTPELAVMEMLNLIPKGQSFDEAMKIMEGLTTLRPKYVQTLLEECNSIKVKRLFLYIAEKNNHSWFNELHLDRINLGSGKRFIVEDGMLDKKYNITVPKEYAG